MEKDFNVLHILGRNGWDWLSYDSEKLGVTKEYTQYAADFIGKDYKSKIVAIISAFPKELDLDGHYGVLWLEAVYENTRDGCFSYNDMLDMQQAIIYAEENLLKIGMPFTENYKFHGKNIANKIRRNKKLRELYNLEELEKKDNG